MLKVVLSFLNFFCFMYSLYVFGFRGYLARLFHLEPFGSMFSRLPKIHSLLDIFGYFAMILLLRCGSIVLLVIQIHCLFTLLSIKIVFKKHWIFASGLEFSCICTNLQSYLGFCFTAAIYGYTVNFDWNERIILLSEGDPRYENKISWQCFGQFWINQSKCWLTMAV